MIGLHGSKNKKLAFRNSRRKVQNNKVWSSEIDSFSFYWVWTYMPHLAPPFWTNFHQTTSPRWTEFLQMACLCGPLYRQTSHWSPYLFWRDFKGPLKPKTFLEVKSSFACFRAAGFHPEKHRWLTRKEHVNLVGFHHKWNLVWQFWLC